MNLRTTLLAALLSVTTVPAAAQSPIEPLAPADPADVATPEAVVEALYASVQRAPGEPFDVDRMRSLFLPMAVMIPNTEQTGGVFRPESPAEWIGRVANYPIGGPEDRGFAEGEIAHRIERFGDIAHVFSTYQKHYWDEDEILGRGINSIQMVHHDDRWWITAIIWDEESGAGPLPERYLPGG